MIELRQIRQLIAASDHGSLHQAASALGVEQSSLSRSIARLERIVGAQLLARSRTGVTPTTAGTEFLRSARFLIALADRMLAKTRAAGQGRAGTLTIGHYSSISAGHLRDTVEAFRGTYPEVEVLPVETTRDLLLAGLDTSVVDLAIVAGVIDHPGLRSERVWNERLMAALPSHHTLAQQASVSWSDIGGEPIVLTASDPGPTFRALLTTKLSSTGKTPLITLLDTSRESMLSMLGSGRDISLLCACGTGVAYPGVAFREVHGVSGQAWVRYSACWRSDSENPALRRFLDFARARYGLPRDLDW